MRFTIYQESRQGGRANNEDRTTYCYSREALLMVVADGMGGHHYGEIASQIAVQTLADSFQRDARPTLADPFRFLQKGMTNAHHAILDYAERHRLSDTPRTTCVACLVQDNIAYWAHAGDSRLFLMRAGKVISQTKDHSRIRMLLDDGLISEAQAARHPDRNKIYSCLGSPTPPEIEFSRKTPLKHGDILLLCTDGLWDSSRASRHSGATDQPDFPAVYLELLTAHCLVCRPGGAALPPGVAVREALHHGTRAQRIRRCRAGAAGVNCRRKCR